MELIRQLWSIFNRRERVQLGLLSVALVIRAGVEMVGVASIMPFMSVVANPEIVQTNPYFAWAYETFGFTSVTGFLTALGVAVVTMLAIANSVSALAQYGMLRFSYGMQHRMSMRLLQGYLAQPYSFFTSRNSASLNKSLLSEVSAVVTGVLIPMLDVLARYVVIAALIGLLLLIDPVLALLVALVLGGVYGAIFVLIKRKQRRLGIARVKANHERFKVSGEAFGGIKDVKVLQREKEFLDRFKPASWQFSSSTASNAVISQLPKYLIETIAFGGIVLIVLYFLQAGDGIEQILPVISLYAFAGYRLMPELQKLFADVTKIRFNRAAVDDFLVDYYAMAPSAKDAPEPLAFEQAITFENVRFSYPDADAPALDGISLRIEKNQTVGLVGASGSGKTTLVDVLLGLYQPQSGHLAVDGTPLNAETLLAWRRQIGYVPQFIFLTDDTIAHNIAFGVPEREVDHVAVERAARIAHLHDFIETLPDGYATVVGERGVRLSGGQRQRIGIARALYHDPEVLVMDEATSALDNATENAVMDAIRDLAGRKTIVLIAHRLTTVEHCDRINMLDHGRVASSGTHAELVTSDTAFRTMAGLAPEPV